MDQVLGDGGLDGLSIFCWEATQENPMIFKAVWYQCHLNLETLIMDLQLKTLEHSLQEPLDLQLKMDLEHQSLKHNRDGRCYCPKDHLLLHE